MTSYAHKAIIDEINELDVLPATPEALSQWVRGDDHMDFVRAGAHADEFVIYASGEYTFIHSMIVPNNVLSPPDKEDLLRWGCNPMTSVASYVSGGGRSGMWIERGPHGTGSRTLEVGMNPIFVRTFDGWAGDDRTYVEMNQELAHLADVHWRPEHRAYCKFDENGDLHEVSNCVAQFATAMGQP